MVRIIVAKGRPKVDPDRARRYRLRTMPVPDASYTATVEELDAMERYTRAWYRNLDNDRPRPGPLAWRDQVEKYAKAKGFRPTFTVQENYKDMTTTYRWERPR